MSGEPDSALVLRTRLQVLRSSLATVEHALEDLEGSRVVPPAIGELDDVGSRIEHLVDALRNDVLPLRDADFDRHITAQNHLRDLELLAQHVKSAARTAVGAHRLVLRNTDVDINIRDHVTDQLEELADVERLLTEADTAEDGHALLASAWERYVERLEVGRKLFAEYVDLVRGVLLRDARLDKDLCRIADELIRPLGRFRDNNWNSITIPAAREGEGVARMRLVRIGFPEWTVWTLPLVAQEIGHFFANRHPRMARLVATVSESYGVAETDVRHWITEAFATGVLGPAYAWAVLFLRADRESEQDRMRVAVILRTLEALDDQALTTYASARQRIAREWSAALRQRPQDEPAAPPVIAEEMREALGEVVEATRKRIPEPYVSGDYERATDIARELSADGADPTAVAATLDHSELRHLLVAGWIARIRLTDAPPDTDASALPEVVRARIDHLAERVRRACVALIDRDEDAAAGPGHAGSGHAAPPPPPPRMPSSGLAAKRDAGAADKAVGSTDPARYAS